METERLYLELANNTYANDLLDAFNSHFVQEYNVLGQMDLQAYQDFLDLEIPNSMQLILVSKDTQMPIGSINLDPDTLRHNADSLQLSYWIKESCARQGYMSEALRACLDYLKDATDVKVITARVFTSNIASQHLLEGLGFTLEGTLKHAVRDNTGIVHDDHLYAYYINR